MQRVLSIRVENDSDDDLVADIDVSDVFKHGVNEIVHDDKYLHNAVIELDDFGLTLHLIAEIVDGQRRITITLDKFDDTPLVFDP